MGRIISLTSVVLLAVVAESSKRNPAIDPALDHYCSVFTPARSPADCTNEAWGDVYQDLFSPDDVCPESKRYVEMGYPGDPVVPDEQLHVSASDTDDGCVSTWGKSGPDARKGGGGGGGADNVPHQLHSH